MPKAKQPKAPRKGGRQTRYRPEYDEQARQLCVMGYTDERLAEFFGVGIATLYRWKQTRPSFKQAVSEGKEITDAKVVSALLQRALGYSHPDVHISNYQGAITVTDITKHYPPDTPAALFWLSNRQPQLFRKDPQPDSGQQAAAPPQIIINVPSADG